MSRAKVLATVVAASVIIAGCAEQPVETEPVGAIVTPEPTAVATPEPTERPTERPTARPTVDTGSVEWLEYLTDRQAWLEGEFQPAMDGWDQSSGNVFIVAMEAVPIWSAVLSEQTDLMFVDPHPCFAAYHAEWSHVIDLYVEGWDVLTDGGIEMDVDKIDRGTAIVNEANVLMAPLTESMDAVTAACME